MFLIITDLVVFKQQKRTIRMVSLIITNLVVFLVSKQEQSKAQWCIVTDLVVVLVTK